MTPEQLKNRLFFKKATTLPSRGIVRKASRRDLNKIQREDDHPNDEFNTFFDFEKDLSGIKSASEQFEELEKNKEKSQESFSDDNLDEFYFEEVLPKSKTNTQGISSANNIGVLVEESDNFSYCEFFDEKNGECKSKKVKNSIYCKEHKMLIINKIKESEGL